MELQPMGIPVQIQSKSAMLQNHIVEIRFCSRGCVINVGCKSIAFENNAEAMSELMAYVEDPHAMTEKWHKIFEEKQP